MNDEQRSAMGARLQLDEVMGTLAFGTSWDHSSTFYCLYPESATCGFHPLAFGATGSEPASNGPVATTSFSAVWFSGLLICFFIIGLLTVGGW